MFDVPVPGSAQARRSNDDIEAGRCCRYVLAGSRWKKLPCGRLSRLRCFSLQAPQLAVRKVSSPLQME
jgi:hypothetical protein